MNANAATLARLPILLIEDERSVMDFISSALERSGYACRTANSAAEGLRILETGHFGGIISDMRTPGGANRPALKGRMFFITGDTVNEDTMRALQSTGVPYLEKPFRVQELINMVEKLFGKAE
jgi:DNA-binding response OmpR family regulator